MRNLYWVLFEFIGWIEVYYSLVKVKQIVDADYCVLVTAKGLVDADYCALVTDKGLVDADYCALVTAKGLVVTFFILENRYYSYKHKNNNAIETKNALSVSERTRIDCL